MVSHGDLLLQLRRQHNARDIDRIIRSELAGLERAYQRSFFLGRKRRGSRPGPPLCFQSPWRRR